MNLYNSCGIIFNNTMGIHMEVVVIDYGGGVDEIDDK